MAIGFLKTILLLPFRLSFHLIFPYFENSFPSKLQLHPHQTLLCWLVLTFIYIPKKGFLNIKMTRHFLVHRRLILLIKIISLIFLSWLLLLNDTFFSRYKSYPGLLKVFKFTEFAGLTVQIARAVHICQDYITSTKSLNS